MIPLTRPAEAPGLQAAIQRIIASRWWGYGAVCSQLEARFTDLHGGHALAMNSGTSALFAAAKALEPAPGDEVIVPALTYISTAVAFKEAGFTVRLADVDSTNLMVTAATVDAALTERTRAVVVVHLYGQRAEMGEIAALCSSRQLALVEDRAHRIGEENPPISDFACYSFNVMKEAPCGDGGLLWCRLEAHCKSARAFSNVGLASDTWERTRSLKHSPYDFDGRSGLKLRGNDLAAGCVLAALDSRRQWQERRREIFSEYGKACQGAPEVLRLRESTVQDSFLMAVLHVPAESRESIRDWFHDAQIATSIHYPALSRHPLFDSERCASAERAAAGVLTLPCYPDMSRADIEAVARTLRTAAEELRQKSGTPS